ncbi:MAG: hypothetical protein Fur003_0370 [Candidatus Dojkabacteria bacterium]
MGFYWEPNGELGHALYDWKAQFMINAVKNYSRKLVNEIGFPIKEVSGANMFNMSHPVVQAYSNLYGDRLYKLPGDKNESELVMSYDASYPQFNLAKMYQLSYKDLPFAHFSVADCYRHEQHGELMLLYRQRRFNMPDLHPYFENVESAFEWYPKIEAKLVEGAKAVGREFFISARVSNESNWEMYKEKIIGIAKSSGRDIFMNVDKVDRKLYWIINIDYKIVDSLNRSREIGCIQIDVGNAKRLGIKYVDRDGSSRHPIIIHSAVPGGIERYLYMAFDRFNKGFPLWLHPIQVRLIPVNDSFINNCLKIKSELLKKGYRVDIDSRSESIGKRVKHAREELIPHIQVYGEKEAAVNNKDFINSLVSHLLEVGSMMR